MIEPERALRLVPYLNPDQLRIEGMELQIGEIITERFVVVNPDKDDTQEIPPFIPPAA